MRPRNDNRIVRAVVALLALGAAALGLVPATAVPAPAADGDLSTLDVSITDTGFQPQEVHVAPGTTVWWTNNGSQPHALISSTGLFESDPLLPGDMFPFSFGSDGSYEYTSGELVGRVVVGNPVDVAGAQAGAPAAPQPASIGGAPGVTPSAAGELAFTGAVETAVLATLGVLFAFAGWWLLAAFGVGRVLEPWRILAFVDPRRFGFTDELLPRGRWRRRPRSTTQANLLPSQERHRRHGPGR